MSPPGSAGTKLLGDVWAVQSQAERKTVAPLMMDTVAKKQGAEEELRNPATQTLTYEVDGKRRRRGRGGVERILFQPLNYPPHPCPPSPQDGWKRYPSVYTMVGPPPSLRLC